MDGMLSQEEISALLNESGVSDVGEQPLTDTEKDAIGEVANISMGTAATTLFSLVNTCQCSTSGRRSSLIFP